MSIVGGSSAIAGPPIRCCAAAKEHGGPLYKVADGQYMCWICIARKTGKEVRQSQHGQVRCPNCGEVLMTKFRRGGIGISSMSMKGNKAILKCECGYEKAVKNPFSRGKPQPIQQFRQLEAKRRQSRPEK